MNKTRRSTALLLGVITLALSITGICATARSQPPGLSAPIEGSWISAVTGAQNPAISFTTLASFTAGGVFVATGSNDRIIPNSPLYGSWKRIGSNRFGVTAYFFTFDPTGTPIAMLRTNENLQLSSRDQMTGVGDLSICDERQQLQSY